MEKYATTRVRVTTDGREIVSRRRPHTRRLEQCSYRQQYGVALSNRRKNHRRYQ